VIQAYRSRSAPSREGEFGSLRVTVADRDLNELTVSMSSGVSLQGRLVLETTNPSPSFDRGGLKIVAVPVDFDASPQGPWAESNGNADGTFELDGLTGTRRLQVMNVPPG
jgi:hypothetical protein